MGRWTTSGLALALLLVAGCRQGDTYDSLVKSRVKLLDEKAAILEGARDRQTAEKAKLGIEEIDERLQEIDKRWDRLAKGQNQDAGFAASFKAYQDNAPALQRVRRRLEAARKKALENKDAARVLEGTNLD